MLNSYNHFIKCYTAESNSYPTLCNLWFQIHTLLWGLTHSLHISPKIFHGLFFNNHSFGYSEAIPCLLWSPLQLELWSWSHSMKSGPEKYASVLSKDHLQFFWDFWGRTPMLRWNKVDMVKSEYLTLWLESWFLNFLLITNDIS